jgi:hypothetical protein
VVAVAGEAHRCDNVGGAAAAGDQPRSSINNGIPHGACAVVAVVVGGDHLASEPVNL